MMLNGKYLCVFILQIFKLLSHNVLYMNMFYLCVLVFVVLYCVALCFALRTPLAVGAADLDGGQVVEEFLEVGVADGRPPGVVSAVVEPEHNQSNTLPTTETR